MNWAVVIPSALALVGVLFGGWWTRDAARSAQKASPYGELAKRVVDLERADVEKGQRLNAQETELDRLRESDARKGLEIIHLRGEVRTLGEHAVEVHQWIEAGMPPPSPKMPEAVARVVQRLRQDLERQHVAEPGATD